MDSDLISRKASLKEIDEHVAHYERHLWTKDTDGSVTKLAMEVIKSQPTVDAVEVVHGEWIGLISEDFVCAEGFNTGMTEKQKGKCLEDFYHRTHCSICNCCFDDRDVKNWNYCPNCGSKMDGGKRDEM